MEFSLPIFTWVQSLKFEDVLFGAHQRGLSCSVTALSVFTCWSLWCHMAALGKELQGPEVHCHPQATALVQGQPRLYQTLSQK